LHAAVDAVRAASTTVVEVMDEIFMLSPERVNVTPLDVEHVEGPGHDAQRTNDGFGIPPMF
jgi:hypothetical protein